MNLDFVGLIKSMTAKEVIAEITLRQKGKAGEWPGIGTSWFIADIERRATEQAAQERNAERFNPEEHGLGPNA